MSFFDEALNAVGGQAGLTADIEQLTTHLGNGGIESILAKFQQGGLGDVVQSWVSTGANLPVSSEQIQSVLGFEQVKNLAGSLGIDPSQIATALPELINHLTPGGQLPQSGVGDLLSNALAPGGLGSVLGGLFKV